MSSTHTRAGSPFIQGSVKVKGKTVTKSLGLSDRVTSKKVMQAAQQLAEGLEQGRTSEALLRLAGAMFDAAGITPPWEKSKDVSVQYVADLYLARAEQKGSLSPITKTAIADFLASFDGSKNAGSITPPVAQAWYDGVVAASSVGTARNKLVVLSGMMANAVRLGYADKNPFAAVEQATTKRVVEKQPMSDADFEKLISYLDRCSRDDAGSWKVAALLGRYAGMRLADAANLTGAAFHEEGGVMLMNWVAGKTGVEVCIPVLEPLRSFIKPDAGWLCCPMLHGKQIPRLSSEFVSIIESSGIEVPTVVNAGRTLRTITFHSLRHRFVQWLVELGIDMKDRMALATHASASSHKIYEHKSHTEEALRLASRLPSNLTSHSI